MPIREDWFNRSIKQLAGTLAKALGLRQHGDFDEALLTTQDAGDDLLGVPRRILDSLDATGAARMLADKRKAGFYAQLLEADAETYAAMGRSEEAESHRARAAAVRANG